MDRWVFRDSYWTVTLYATVGMLIYIAFRLEWIYVLGSVIAVFHATLITIGLFSIFHEEMSMTVPRFDLLRVQFNYTCFE